MTALEVEKPLNNPFPGLRPFEPEESHLFKGRDRQTQDLTRKLEDNRFVAVVGVSGSGKSSLVKAGLIANLYKGYMRSAGPRWQVALFRPGDTPIEALADTLNQPDVLGAGSCTPESLLASDRELIRAASCLDLDQNLLVIVDQFEELFRFRRTDLDEGQKKIARENANHFVRLLIAASAKPQKPEDPNVYVIITMRSDFLGNCADFRDLPEAINKGQYLIPRMTRAGLREAIVEPVQFRGAKIEPAFVDDLLDQTGDEPNLLPVIQHALMRTWERWKSKKARETGEDADLSDPIIAQDYIDIGGFEDAMNRHAEEAYGKLAERPGRQDIAKLLFQRITLKISAAPQLGVAAKVIRDPKRVSDIVQVAGERLHASRDEVLAVIGHFRDEASTFLSSADEKLADDSVVDLMHESLIGLWKRLGDPELKKVEDKEPWVYEEANSAEWYERLSDEATRVPRESFWQETSVEYVLGHYYSESALVYRWTLSWSRRYNQLFETATQYLEESKTHQDNDRKAKEDDRKAREAADREAEAFQARAAIASSDARIARAQAALKDRQAARNRLIAFFFGLLALLLLGSSLFALRQYRAAEKANARAEVLKAQEYADAGEDVEALAYVAHALRHDPSLPETWLSLTSLLLRGFRSQAFFHHQGPVLSASFSPDGTRIVTASDDKTAQVWDAVSGSKVGKPLTHKGVVVWATFSPNSKRVVTASEDGTAQVWEAETGNRVGKALQHEAPVNRAAFSHDGKQVVTASGDKTAQVWNADNGEKIGPALKHEGAVFDAAFSPTDGGLVVTASADGTAQVWDLASGQTVSLRHKAEVVSAAFSPDGNWVVTASFDGTAQVWEAKTGSTVGPALHHQELSPDENPAPVAKGPFSPVANPVPPLTKATFSPDGKWVVTASADGSAQVWDAASGKAVGGPLRPSRLPMRDAAFSPDNKWVVTASEDGTAQQWDASTGNRVGPPLTHLDAVHTAVFSPDIDGKWLLTGSADTTARIWKAITSKQMGPPPGMQMGQPPETETKFATHAAFSPDGRWVVMAFSDGTAQVWDPTTPREPVKHPLLHAPRVSDVAFSPDSKWVVTGFEDGTAQVWDTAGNARSAPLDCQGGIVNRVAFSPDNKRVVTVTASANDKADTAQVWDWASGRKGGGAWNVGPKVSDLAFSPNGKWIVIVSVSPADIVTATVRDVANGTSEKLLRGNPVNRAAFNPNPNSTQVVTASVDGNAQVWDWTGAKWNPGKLLRHERAVSDAAFSPDGKFVVTASADTAQVWEVKTGLRTGPPLRHNAPVDRAAFSADGNWVITRSEDGKARVWQTFGGQQIGLPLGHGIPILWAAFSPDGKRVVMASADGTPEAPQILMGNPKKDARLMADVAQFLSGYEVTEPRRLVPINDWPERFSRLREQASGSGSSKEPAFAAFLQKLFPRQ